MLIAYSSADICVRWTKDGSSTLVLPITGTLNGLPKWGLKRKKMFVRNIIIYKVKRNLQEIKNLKEVLLNTF